MTKETFILIRGLLWGLLIGLIFSRFLPTKQPPVQDYQIELVGSTLKLYDSARYVGKCSYYNTELEKLIINDNQ